MKRGDHRDDSFQDDRDRLLPPQAMTGLSFKFLAPSVLFLFAACDLLGGASFTSDWKKQVLIGLFFGSILFIPLAAIQLGLQLLTNRLLGRRGKFKSASRPRSLYWGLNAPAIILFFAILLATRFRGWESRIVFQKNISAVIPAGIKVCPLGYSGGIGESFDFAFEFRVPGGGATIMPLLRTNGYTAWENGLQPHHVSSLQDGIGSLTGSSLSGISDGYLFFYIKSNSLVKGVLLSSNEDKAYYVESEHHWLPPSMGY